MDGVNHYNEKVKGAFECFFVKMGLSQEGWNRGNIFVPLWLGSFFILKKYAIKILLKFLEGLTKWQLKKQWIR